MNWGADSRTASHIPDKFALYSSCWICSLRLSSNDLSFHNVFKFLAHRINALNRIKKKSDSGFHPNITSGIKVVALGNFKYFEIYFKMGYYLRISANKFEYLSVTRIGTWLFYANIVVALYLLIINLLPCPLGPVNLKNLIFCGPEIKILSLFLRILQKSFY